MFTDENYVTCNLYKWGLSLIQYLADRGHGRIGYLGNGGNPGNVDRYRGYCTALRETGIPPCEEMAVMADSKHGLERGKAEVFAAQNCDAAVCFDDYMAITPVNHFRGTGVQVPRDVSVTGFDDSPLRRVFVPKIVPVRQPMCEMAFLASRWLRDNIINRHHRPRCADIEGTLAEGERAAPAVRP